MHTEMKNKGGLMEDYGRWSLFFDTKRMIDVLPKSSIDLNQILCMMWFPNHHITKYHWSVSNFRIPGRWRRFKDATSLCRNRGPFRAPGGELLKEQIETGPARSRRLEDLNPVQDKPPTKPTRIA